MNPISLGASSFFKPAQNSNSLGAGAAIGPSAVSGQSAAIGPSAMMDQSGVIKPSVIGNPAKQALLGEAAADLESVSNRARSMMENEPYGDRKRRDRKRVTLTPARYRSTPEERAALRTPEAQAALRKLGDILLSVRPTE